MEPPFYPRNCTPALVSDLLVVIIRLLNSQWEHRHNLGSSAPLLYVYRPCCGYAFQVLIPKHISRTSYYLISTLLPWPLSWHLDEQPCIKPSWNKIYARAGRRAWVLWNIFRQAASWPARADCIGGRTVYTELLFSSANGWYNWVDLSWGLYVYKICPTTLFCSMHFLLYTMTVIYNATNISSKTTCFYQIPVILQYIFSYSFISLSSYISLCLPNH